MSDVRHKQMPFIIAVNQIELGDSWIPVLTWLQIPWITLMLSRVLRMFFSALGGDVDWAVPCVCFRLAVRLFAVGLSTLYLCRAVWFSVGIRQQNREGHLHGRSERRNKMPVPVTRAHLQIQIKTKWTGKLYHPFKGKMAYSNFKHGTIESNLCIEADIRSLSVKQQGCSQSITARSIFQITCSKIGYWVVLFVCRFLDKNKTT